MPDLGCQLDLDLDDDDDDDDDDENGDHGSGGSMPEAFHWQASHTPRVGNQAYPGTLNFRGGLTDAAFTGILIHQSGMAHIPQRSTKSRTTSQTW